MDFRRLKNGVGRSPSRWFYDFHALYRRYLRNERGIGIMEADWDNLIVLDACRYDTYADRQPFDSSPERVVSRGSTTTEFVNRNFTDETYYDTIYITANPHVDEQLHGRVHALESLWISHWDDEHNTVLPETVTEVAGDVASAVRDKRLVIHYIQPHRPFLGETGRELEEGSGLRGHREYALGKDPDWSEGNPYNRAKRGELDPSRLRVAYQETLDRVLSSLEELLPLLEGRTVITADHGNVFEDRWPALPPGGFPHPGNVRIPELVDVPWHVIETGKRREITSEPPDENVEQYVEEAVVAERLADLGYLDS